MLTSTSSEMATRRRRITSTVTGSIAAADAGLASMVAGNVDLSELADREGVARADDRARSVLDNKGRPLPVETQLQRIAVIHLGRQEPILLEKKDRSRLQLRLGPPAHRPRETGDIGPVHVQGRQRMQHHQLDLRGRIGVTVAPLIFLVEPRAQFPGVVGFHEWNLDRVMLALVSHLGLALDRDGAVTELAAQRGSPLGFELAVYGHDFGEIVRIEPDDKRLRG